MINKKYFLYHLRWQISAWVMLPFMYLFQFLNFPLWLNLMAGQFIGAIIFWKIDHWIFKEKKDKKDKKELK